MFSIDIAFEPYFIIFKFFFHVGLWQRTAKKFRLNYVPFSTVIVLKFRRRVATILNSVYVFLVP